MRPAVLEELRHGSGVRNLTSAAWPRALASVPFAPKSAAVFSLMVQAGK